MASQLTFDELNRLDQKNKDVSKIKKRSVPYNEFFGEMYLPEEEKEKRIEMANALDDVFLFLFAILGTLYAAGGASITSVYEMTERRYMDAISPFLAPVAIESTSLRNTVANQARLIVDTTVQHLNEAYYTSEDRARFIAENQANVVQNRVNEEEAIAQGFTHKTWVTMRDNHVRTSHHNVDGKSVPIMTPFDVGDAQMMHPCDDSLGAGAEEIVGCRCVLEYT